MSIAEDAHRLSAGPDKRAAQIAVALEDEIIGRGWPVGELLGRENELRERFGVSQSVLRQAIRLLEHHKVAGMRRGRGGGLVVSAPDASPATRALVIYLEYVGTSVEDLLRARRLLEPLAARLAAESVTEAGVDRLRGIVGSELSRPDRSAEDEFHVTLGQLSGNVVLQLFLEVLTWLSGSYARTARRPTEASLHAATEVSAARHAEIVDAVIAGDGVAAEVRVGTHLDEIEAWLLAHRVQRPARGTRTRPVDPNPDGGPGGKRGEVLAGRIHDDIAAEGRQVGEVIGLEQDLLTRYRVSRAVLREAVRILEHHSVARMRRGPGGGLVIVAPDPAASIHTMALYLDYKGTGPEQLRSVRDAIELGCIQTLGAAAAPPEAAAAPGDAFHLEIARLAGNPVLLLFLRVVLELGARHGRRGPTRCAGHAVGEAHEAILDAIVSGDEGLAQLRMRRHLQALV
ncbi:FCD domain-containing protein [Pseudonocardia ailaonensis]|uniref:FCD domain-containing protein n=1 Tax=Pseudonocardia ailaonensis TaxID=367279 RepID=A0ABN2MTY6_9PSEU